MSEPIKLVKGTEKQTVFAPSTADELLKSGWALDDGSAPMATAPATETPLKAAPKAKTAPRRRKTASK